MSTDAFAHSVEYVLLMHRENAPIGDCEPCSSGSWPKWRDHVADLIAQDRIAFDNAHRTRQPRDFGVLLALHAPYTLPGGTLQCHECLDGNGAGEYATTADWARHVSQALTKLGLRVGWKP